MEIVRGPRKRLERTAALALANALGEAAARRPKVTLGIVGGRSVGGVYRLLAEQRVPWGAVHVFMADERMVPENAGTGDSTEPSKERAR